MTDLDTGDSRTFPGKSGWLWLLVLVAACILFGRLDGSRFWDQDEGFFATTAAEMHARGDWIVPTFNGELFGHKPPWMYWMMMTGYSLFGPGELGARFFSAVFGLATVLLTFRLGERLFNRRTGLIAGLVLGTCLMFSVVSRAATPDVFLVFFSSLALYQFATRGFLQTRPTPAGSAPVSIRSMLPGKRADWVRVYAPMGIAALVKGPIGFLFPMAIIGLFLLVMTPVASSEPGQRAGRLRHWARFGPLNFLRTLRLMRLPLAAAVILLVAGPWYALVGILTEGAFHAEFFGVHHYQRFVTPMDNHSGPVYYYLLALLIGLFPWSIYGGPAVLHWWRDVRRQVPDRTALVFAGCWAGVYVGLFSLAGTKLPNYVLPAFPALALLLARFVDGALFRETREIQHLRRPVLISLVGLATTGFILSIGLPAFLSLASKSGSPAERWQVAESTLDILNWLAWLGVPLLAGGLVAIWLAGRGRLTEAIGTASLASVLFIGSFHLVLVPRVDQFQTPQEMAQLYRMGRESGEDQLAMYGFFRPSMVYYGKSPIHQCNNRGDVRRFLRQGGREAWLVVSEEALVKLQPLENLFDVVERRRNFPDRGDVLLLRGRTAAARASLPRQAEQRRFDDRR